MTLRILLNDYAGHAFPLQLSEWLAGRGHGTTHAFCASNTTPHGDSARAAALGVDVVPIDLGRPFDKYGLVRRLIDELDYGIRSGWLVARERPDIAILTQLPVISLLVSQLTCRVLRIPTLLWLQDLQGDLASVQSNLAGVILSRLEALAIRRADAVVTISSAMADTARRWRKDHDIAVIENWAEVPIDRPTKDNAWSRSIRATETFNIVYSGSLGVKHRPDALAALADHFRADEDVRILAACEGRGRDCLEADPETPGKLEFFDLVPARHLDLILATADVLVVLLDDAVATSVVPSKVLAYLAAGRPVLGLLPASNLAAEIIGDRAAAGIACVDIASLLQEADRLRQNPPLCVLLGDAGRRYAEKEFDLNDIARRFVKILDRLDVDRHPQQSTKNVVA